MQLVRPFARRWRRAVVCGGPSRAAALHLLAAARRDFANALRGALAAGRLDTNEATQVSACCARLMREWQLRVRGLLTSVSIRAALREWRFVAILREWRVRAAPRMLPVFEPGPDYVSRHSSSANPYSALVVDLLGWVATWRKDSCRRGDRPKVLEADVWRGFAGACAHSRAGLELRAVIARSKLRWIGGRRRFMALKGYDVQAGFEPDRFGFWAVARLVQVRKPAGAKGRQLDVLVEFEGCNPMTREAWPQRWLPITNLKPDLKAEARAMEAAMRAVQSMSASATAVAAAACRAARKRAWRGLIWDGAEEGRPRRSRRLDVPASDGAPVLARVVAPPPVSVTAVPGGRIAQGAWVSVARYLPGGVVAVAMGQMVEAGAEMDESESWSVSVSS